MKGRAAGSVADWEFGFVALFARVLSLGRGSRDSAGSREPLHSCIENRSGYSISVVLGEFVQLPFVKTVGKS